MSRRARSRGLVVGLCCAMVATIACGTSPDEQLLLQFFHAARNLDNTLTARLGTARFNPRTDGSVESFAVKSIGPDTRRALPGDDDGVKASLATLTDLERETGGVSVDTIAREVTIDAQVRMPDGALTARTLIVTIQRSRVTGPGAAREGRWIVTALRQTPASQTSRAASSAPRS